MGIRLAGARWLAFSVLWLVTVRLPAAERFSLESARSTVTATELQTHVNVLADDTLEGREAGSRGARAAAGYIVQRLEDLGVAPAGDRGGFTQAFGAGYRNILARIEGSHPELRREVILIGGHYDHVGYGTPTNSYGPLGHIHNGADDNASGVAGLLEVAEALMSLPVRPRRSILLAFWDGEEKGLLGSWHWVNHPTTPLSTVKTAINIDMIGRLRDRRLEVIGARTGAGFRQLASRQTDGLELRLNFDTELKSDSDHYPFFARKIPVLMLNTGLHGDYHRPSDDSHLLNAEGMQAASRLLLNLSVELAERAEPIRFRPESQLEPARKSRAAETGPNAGSRFGIRWKTMDEQGGITVTQVAAGSAAEHAKLHPGDRLLEFAGEPVTDDDRFRRDVWGATSPVTIVVQRQGRGEPVSMSIPLAGQPVRVGVTWREDDAEPHAVEVTRVLPGTPADTAGLRPGDRIYEVAGDPIENGDSLRHLLRTAPAPLELMVEREGTVSSIALDVLPPTAFERGRE